MKYFWIAVGVVVFVTAWGLWSYHARVQPVAPPYQLEELPPDGDDEDEVVVEQPGRMDAPAHKTDDDEFTGQSRMTPKTTPFEGELEEFFSVSALRGFLDANDRCEEHMLALHLPRTGDAVRHAPEETLNVRVLAYLYAFKREGDNDYHLIIGDNPKNAQPRFVNAEVSALPSGGPYRAKLEAIRTEFEKAMGRRAPGGGYVAVHPPRPVTVTGSLFFDMDHAPPKPYVGAADFQPGTAWEIHPITAISFR